MSIDLVYFVIMGFVVETFTEMIKIFFEMERKYTLIVAILLGILFAILTTTQGLKYQLSWNDIPEWVSNIITGICIANFAKFYDYIYKFTRLKEN